MANSPTEYELVAQGQFFSQQGLLDKAIECFDRAIVENSNFAAAYYYRHDIQEPRRLNASD